ncbi:hypothetical protein [Vulcanisaeta souniana]|uniref:THUMP domain-containing protein n=1 Tax=Vulcanisaeta souniana JCM 11219 TaxID=1293586 RepID=A0A830EG16_9CREN|nr:hypothetical protein [Vulcanisaeta souniana]BDR93571.1 hypothetical protein Vsou_26640 [Vulcanisaeta souniana JCM 11219]GGI79176.1 hypothetical protein GCM10007112_15200 [Vulcanisaeta souniana JCM 11219]
MTGKVLITVKLSFEYYLRQDIKDYLFFFDQNVKVNPTEFRGVLIVESMKDPRQIANLLINSPISDSVLTSVVPIITEGNYNVLSDLLGHVRDNINHGCRAFIVRCRLRGSLIGNDECERAVITLVRNFGFHAVYRGDTDCAIVIEGLGSWFGIYVGPRSFVKV